MSEPNYHLTISMQFIKQNDKHSYARGHRIPKTSFRGHRRPPLDRESTLRECAGSSLS